MRFGEREKWADCQGNCFSRFVGIGGGTGGDLRKGRDWVGAEFLKGRILAVAVLGDWQRNRVDDQIHGGKFSGYQIAMRPNLPSSFILLQKSFRKSAAAFESLPSPLRKGPFEKKTEAGQPSSRLQLQGMHVVRQVRAEIHNSKPEVPNEEDDRRWAWCFKTATCGRFDLTFRTRIPHKHSEQPRAECAGGEP